MNRIDETFRRLRKEKKKAFIAYITAGDPTFPVSEKIALTLAETGTDIIELGIPFSDPLADGPTIQKAVQRSLKNGCTVKKVFTMVKSLRRKIQTPLVFMTYYNIVYNYGLEKFVKDAKKSGADGIIIPDLPMEESGEFKSIADAEDFCLIMLTAPTTPAERFRKIASKSRGFIYHVSLTGVTGTRDAVNTGLAKNVQKLKKLTKKPICVGFGVSGAEQAKKISRMCDGVIVGSAIIKIIEKNLNRKKDIAGKIKVFSKTLAKAVHGEERS
ncbi:MAG: tryptophan synthase subunit alpha [Candidatus Aadella gelida]|nr:tryptophan synthase subunit alpha [Candidatus Aadella gelida]